MMNTEAIKMMVNEMQENEKQPALDKINRKLDRLEADGPDANEMMVDHWEKVKMVLTMSIQKDMEWVQLMKEAKQQGLTVKEIKKWLENNK